MFALAPSQLDAIDTLFKWGRDCFCFCLIGGFVLFTLVFKTMAKHPPPASDNDENPKD
jgi:hypothetical protein